MSRLTRHPWATCLLSLAALAFTRPGARAQLPLNSAAYFRQLNGLGAALALNPLSGLGGVGSAASLAGLSANPYGAGGLANGLSGGGYNPYGSYYEDPNGAYLRGGAQVITSQGRFMVSQQQAYVLRAQVRAEVVANSRKRFDEWLYERENTPSAEAERLRFQLQSAQRARNNPTLTEIWSGKSLNDILVDLQKHPVSGVSAERGNLPDWLREDGLGQINVTKGAGSVGVLKNGGRLQWPVALAGPDYAEARDRLAHLAEDEVRQAEFNGQADADIIRQMTGELDKLTQRLRKAGQGLSVSEYIEAKTFLGHFGDAVTALRQGEVGNYFAGQNSRKVNTIAELVKYMTEQGLQFAPALPGDRRAYTVLHQALAAYGAPGQEQTTERRSPLSGDSKGTY
jgi:hypothetical protein